MNIKNIFAEINSRILYKIVVEDIYTRGANKNINDTTLCIISNNETIIYQLDVNYETCHCSRFYSTDYSLGFPIGLLKCPKKKQGICSCAAARFPFEEGICHQRDIEEEKFPIIPSLIWEPKSRLKFPVENEIVDYEINGCDSYSNIYII
jgi:hypothetical protein